MSAVDYSTTSRTFILNTPDERFINVRFTRKKQTQKGSAEALERLRTGDSTRAQCACSAHVAQSRLEPATPHKILASVATVPVAGHISDHSTNSVKLSTQSADKWICMGKWPVPGGGIYFHHIVVLARVPGF